MKARKLPGFLMLLSGLTGYCATITVTAGTSAMSFSPQHINITTADGVAFEIAFAHNAVEVSQTTYNANQPTALPGGFNVDFGGGFLDPGTLSVGVHYYVCQAHIGSGMKGTITVTALGVNDFELVKSFSVFPNPATDFLNIKADDGFQNMVYKIVDVHGKQVQDGCLSEINTQIDLRHFAAGTYFLQLGDNKRQVFQIVKK